MWKQLLLAVISFVYPISGMAFDDPQLNDLINHEYAHCEVIPHASLVGSPFVDELSMYNVCVGEVLEKVHDHIVAAKQQFTGISYAVLGGDFNVAHKKDIAEAANQAMNKKYSMLKGYHVIGKDMCLFEQKNEHKGSCYRVMLN